MSKRRKKSVPENAEAELVHGVAVDAEGVSMDDAVVGAEDTPVGAEDVSAGDAPMDADDVDADDVATDDAPVDDAAEATDAALIHDAAQKPKKARSAWWVAARAALPGALKRLPNHLKPLPKRAGRWCVKNFRVDFATIRRLFLDGVLVRNPALTLLLGLCAALGTTASLRSATGMGVAVAATLICSNVTVSLLRSVIPARARAVCCLAVIAVFSTAAEACVRAWFPALADELGVFLPLIAVNTLLLSRAEAVALEHIPGVALVDGAAMGLGYAAALALLGAARELLGSGSIAGVPLFDGRFPPVLLAAMPCGGFLLLGGMLACAQWLRGRDWKRPKGGAES